MRRRASSMLWVTRGKEWLIRGKMSKSRSNLKRWTAIPDSAPLSDPARPSCVNSFSQSDSECEWSSISVTSFITTSGPSSPLFTGFRSRFRKIRQKFELSSQLFSRSNPNLSPSDILAVAIANSSLPWSSFSREKAVVRSWRGNFVLNLCKIYWKSSSYYVSRASCEAAANGAEWYWRVVRSHRELARARSGALCNRWQTSVMRTGASGGGTFFTVSWKED